MKRKTVGAMLLFAASCVCVAHHQALGESLYENAIKTGDDFLQAKNYGKAADSYIGAAAKAKPYSSEQVVALNKLVSVRYAQKKYTLAAHTMKQVINILQAIRNPNDSTVKNAQKNYEQLQALIKQQGLDELSPFIEVELLPGNVDYLCNDRKLRGTVKNTGTKFYRHFILEFDSYNFAVMNEETKTGKREKVYIDDIQPGQTKKWESTSKVWSETVAVKLSKATAYTGGTAFSDPE